MAELERLVAQKTPLPGLWQHVLSDTMGTTLKSLNSAFSKYLMTPDISTISEVKYWIPHKTFTFVSSSVECNSEI